MIILSVSSLYKSLDDYYFISELNNSIERGNGYTLCGPIILWETMCKGLMEYCSVNHRESAFERDIAQHSDSQSLRERDNSFSAQVEITLRYFTKWILPCCYINALYIIIVLFTFTSITFRGVLCTPPPHHLQPFNKTIFCQSTQPPVSYHPNHVWLHRGDLSCCWSAAPQLWISPLSPTATSVHEPRCPRFVSGQQHLLFVDAHLNTHWAAVHVLYYLTSGLIGFCLKHHITTICCWITSILRICFCQQVQGEQYSYSSSAF